MDADLFVTSRPDNFYNNLPRWERWVLPFLAGIPRPSVLLVGALDGVPCDWIMRKTAGTCSPTVLAMSSARVDTLRSNMRRYAGSVRILEGNAWDLSRVRGAFDFAYLDDLPDARDALDAAVLCFRRLRPGGMMVIDNYTHDRRHGNACPRSGIDAFLNVYAEHVKVLEAGWQIVLVRRRKPLALDACRSELYHEDPSRV